MTPSSNGATYRTSKSNNRPITGSAMRDASAVPRRPTMNSNRSFARRLLANCILASVLAATAWCGTALAAPSCSDFSGPKCQARLSTDITMRYREIGRQNRDAVFLLHGYTDSSRSWERVAPLLHRLPPGADIIIPDLRGHGDSSMPSRLPPPTQAPSGGSSTDPYRHRPTVNRPTSATTYRGKRLTASQPTSPASSSMAGPRRRSTTPTTQPTSTASLPIPTKRS